ncbi:MAG: dihydropteroate synthase [Candidatus Omnitrophica bacterium]|nr:dihydropteroate synthase [Candidatus Omnitrophota bacterium]
MLQILQLSEQRQIEKIMQEIGVDPYGIRIMAPKAITYLIRINSISNITANILKQEMLSLGAEVAVARSALTGRIKKTDCLLMGNLVQFKRLCEKLNKQPFGLDRLANKIDLALANYQNKNFKIDLDRYHLNLDDNRPLIMGIVNLTPDSFSGDGLYPSLGKHYTSYIDNVINFVEKMVKDGADIIDVGGESTRPGAEKVSVKEELERTIPVIKVLAKRIKVPISIDTYKPQVAKQALECGAVMVNDISGLRDSKMRRLVAKYKCGVVIMHMKGTPRTMQINPVYKSLIDELISYLDKAIETALSYGIDKEKIIIDPGIGFGKTVEHNLEILGRLKEFKVLGRPILVGPSRKSFIGKILNLPVQERLFGTISSCILAVKNGANIVRVHDVRSIKQALKIMQEIEQR